MKRKRRPPEFKFEYGASIIDYIGPFVRLGKEGKWVEVFVSPVPRLSRRELLDVIEDMDRERTH